jgi:hypothetical protein
MDWAEMFSYGWAVGFYWLAIMAWVAFMTGDLLGWFGLKGRMDKLLPAKRRRVVEVIIMVAVVFYAGYQAWHDQLAATKDFEQKFQEAERLASSRLGEIQGSDGTGGLKGQIAELERQLANRPAANNPPQPDPRQAYWDGVVTALRNEYVQFKLAHEGASQRLTAGTELPPDDWMNMRLKELNENFRVRANGLKWDITTVP